MNPPAILAMGLLLMAAAILTAGLIVRHSSFYRRELAEVQGRDLSLDGLRGMAALLVATYHAALMFTQIRTGRWGDAGSPVLQMFGPGGVLIFFMLTGHLFWSKARSSRGKFKVFSLWRGRIFRIGPLYLFSLLCIMMAAGLEHGWGWIKPENLSSLLALLPLGVCHWQNVGGLDLGHYNNGVVWTLWYEWRFYLVLPFMAWLAVGRRTYWLAGAAYVATVAALWFSLNLQPGLAFLLGMLCPVLLGESSLRIHLQRPAMAVGAVLLALILILGNRPYAISTLPSSALAGALFPLFFVVAAGNSLGGFLLWPAVRCLGAISYSVYLLHSLIFYCVMAMVRAGGLMDRMEFWYWPVMLLTISVVIILCAVTYRWIEFPFILRSHRRALSVGK